MHAHIHRGTGHTHSPKFSLLAAAVPPLPTGAERRGEFRIPVWILEMDTMIRVAQGAP